MTYPTKLSTIHSELRLTGIAFDVQNLAYQRCFLGGGGKNKSSGTNTHYSACLHGFQACLHSTHTTLYLQQIHLQSLVAVVDGFARFMRITYPVVESSLNTYRQQIWSSKVVLTLFNCIEITNNTYIIYDT